jgi:hypothetical protein
VSSVFSNVVERKFSSQSIQAHVDEVRHHQPPPAQVPVARGAIDAVMYALPARLDPFQRFSSWTPSEAPNDSKHRESVSSLATQGRRWGSPRNRTAKFGAYLPRIHLHGRARGKQSRPIGARNPHQSDKRRHRLLRLSTGSNASNLAKCSGPTPIQRFPGSNAHNPQTNHNQLNRSNSSASDSPPESTGLPSTAIVIRHHGLHLTYT